MRKLIILFASLFAFALPAQVSYAGVTAKIDISEQRIYVSVNGHHKYTWKISTGRGGYRTPTGNYRPTFLSPNHRSSKYNNAPMPHSVFFHRGYAIHGTNAISRLGRPASHGCIRLHPANARKFFKLVKRHGRAGTRIRIRH